MTCPPVFDSKWMIEEIGPLPAVSPVMTIEYVPGSSPAGSVTLKDAAPDASTGTCDRTTGPGYSVTVTVDDGARPRGLMDTVDPPTACPGCIVVDICISRVGDEPSAARSSPVGTICAASAPVGVDGMGPVGTGPVVVVPGTMVVVVEVVAAPDAEMATGDEPVWP